MGNKISIVENSDMLDSYWVTGSVVERIFKTLKIAIKPQIAVMKLKNGTFDVHFDSDNSGGYQFNLDVLIPPVVKHIQFIKYDLRFKIPSFRSSNALKIIMEASRFSCLKNFRSFSVNDVMTLFLTNLDNSIKGRFFE